MSGATVRRIAGEQAQQTSGDVTTRGVDIGGVDIVEIQGVSEMPQRRRREGDGGWGGTALAAVAGLLALAGVAVWITGDWSMRHDEVVGANIGAGLLLLLSWGLFALAVLTGVAAVVVHLAQRRRERDSD